MNCDAFVGKPYRRDARGPDAFDCWGLMMAAGRALFNQALPDLAPTIAGRRRWREVDTLAPGVAVVLMNLRGRPYHVGLYLGGGRVLHTIANGGARVEPVRTFALCAASWKGYRWAG